MKKVNTKAARELHIADLQEQIYSLNRRIAKLNDAFLLLKEGRNEPAMAAYCEAQIKPSSQRRYSSQLKATVIDEIVAGSSAYSVAQRYGISYSTVHRWKQEVLYEDESVPHKLDI